MDLSIYGHKKVLVTGHTGFKGAWMVALLRYLEADVYGLALPATSDSLYSSMRPLGESHEFFVDIRNKIELERAIENIKPEIIFHLAAQSLVRLSYEIPAETFATNVQGTVNLLDISLKQDSIKTVVAITTDKVYRNTESGIPFCETDPLGGLDPYSASKAAMEMAINAWQPLFNAASKDLVSARAGNVIGTGDRARDRLLPDLIKSLVNLEKITIRNPESIRPWQHVLDPLTGYLTIGMRSMKNFELKPAYNFGPPEESHKKVSDIANLVCEIWPEPRGWSDVSDPLQLHEAGLLRLNSTLAQKNLEWKNLLDLNTALSLTLSGEKDLKKLSADEVLIQHISQYFGKI